MLAAPVVQADDNGPAAVATMRSIEPAVPQPGDTLVLAGTVENTGDEPLRAVQAILRYSTVPLTDRAEVRRVATDDDLRFGRRYVEFFQELGPADSELQPGETVEYRLEVPVDQINLGEPGVYVVGVDIRANPPDEERLTLDTARTVIPWVPDGDPLPTVPVALLWPVATQPSLLPDGTLLGDRLASQIAPDGPLTALVEAPGSAPVTWVVDPDLLATVATMTDGYVVTAPEGTTADGIGAADAAAWQEAFGAAVDGHELLFLPYADPDLSALAEAHPDEATRTARQALVATQELAAGRDPAEPAQIAWPGSGVASERSLAAYAAAGTRTVVLSSGAVIPATDEARAQVRAGETTLDAVLTDVGLESAMDAAGVAGSAGGDLALRQSWLAETLLVALSAEADQQSPAPLVAAPPSSWHPDAAVARALIEVWTTTPWVSPTSLAEVAPAGRPALVGADPEVTVSPPELPATNVAAAAALADQSTRYTALLAGRDALVEELDTAALRAVATAWRSAPEAGRTYTAVATSEVTSRLRQVSVLVPETVTLSSDRGTFPLTLSNGLPQPVLVRVLVDPDYPDRMSVAEVPPQRVEAGENATVEITAEATANGRVPVTVRLETAGGSGFGPPHRMIVHATDYGTIGWVVVGAALALFLTAAVLRLIRARRRPVDVVELPAASVAKEEPLRETAR